MKHLYIVRRHRLEADHYQGTHRRVPAYTKQYEVLFATSEVALANARKQELECGHHMAHKVAPFKYSIGRVQIK